MTRKFPYVDNGWHIGDREGKAVRMKRFILQRSRWESVRRDDITIEGLDDGCFDLLGLR